MLQWLKNRLLLTDLLTRHPEIHDIELVPPVVIAGLPRTGTTHLHNLLAAAPTFRTIPYWESNEPFPLPSEAGVEPDPRRTRMDVAVEFMNLVMPHFALMHEMTTDHVHEEIQLLANDFSSMLFETLGHVPRWRDYYLSHDQTPHYEHLATQLKALQFLRGGRRWLLKSPQHLEQLPVLNAVFPGVVVVFTHRDPVPVVLSMLAMLTYSARMHCASGAGAGDRRDLDRPPRADAQRVGPRSRHSAAGALDRRPLRRLHGRRNGRRLRDLRPRRRAGDRRGARGDRATTWRDTSAAGSAGSRRRPKCSVSTRTTCEPGSPVRRALPGVTSTDKSSTLSIWLTDRHRSLTVALTTAFHTAGGGT